MTKLTRWWRILPLLLLPMSILATDQSWKQHVSNSERARVNPYANRSEASAAGSHLFADHCSKCHGDDALGRGKKPSLRTVEVQAATDGELFWILRNGFLRRGMPSWSGLPEASRWQIVVYLKSLGLDSESQSANVKNGGER